MKKFSLVIVFLLIISMGLSACTGKFGTGTSSDTVTSSENPDALTDNENGDGYIVKNGISSYKVVIPENADSYVNFAALELVNFIYKGADVLVFSPAM